MIRPITAPTILALLLITPRIGCSQLIAYESFTALATGSGLSGSGSDATGWTDGGWVGGSDARFHVVDPIPDLSFQPNGGVLVNGGNRAVQLTTNPEPVPGGGLVAVRSFAPQNTTLYASFLVRPVSVGTGSDILGMEFRQGSTFLGGWLLKPDQGQQYFRFGFVTSAGSSGSSNGATNINPGQTYFIVIRFTVPSPKAVGLDLWINPPASYTSANKAGSGNASFNSNVVADSIGLAISSADTGGPTSTIAVDEFRIGYTWNDVVPQGPAPPTVPELQITRAVKLSWPSDSTKAYQPQTSYDLSNWFNLGSSINGTGSSISIFDSTDMDAEKFYRVQVR